MTANKELQEHRLRLGPSLLVTLNDAITGYAETEGTDIDCAIRDALTDIRHLCDVHGLDYGDIDERAYSGYLEENSEEWRGEYVEAGQR